MSNYKIIKEYNLEEMALLFHQLTLRYHKLSIDKLPTAKDWKTYLSSNSMFLPLSK